jgi:hypothetical protein
MEAEEVIMAKEKITMGREPDSEAAARRAAWNSRELKRLPVNVQMLFDILKDKGIVTDSDLPMEQR